MAKARRHRPHRARSTPTGGLGREHWRADGQAKTPFATVDEANRSAMGLRMETGADLDPYRCTWCGAWHLGTRNKGADADPGPAGAGRR